MLCDKGRPTHQQLIGHDAERVHVRLAIDLRRSQALLRSHVRGVPMMSPRVRSGSALLPAPAWQSQSPRGFTRSPPGIADLG